ncbi:AAA family ATPase [Ruegeria sp. EL01]|uniref:GumC family protein n=1 Tax=Ruegeria sp. EL01 TaxID=2107578 RepID=UPI000EA8045F|nr:AAA family ATPase [Ruegeria sp. EL01]
MPDNLERPYQANQFERFARPMIWTVLRRHAVLMIGICILFFVAAYFVLKRLEPSYSAQSTVVMAQLDTRVRTTDVQLETFELSRVAIETQLDILRSRVFAADVAQNMDLYTNTEFMPAPPPDQPAPPELRREQVVDKLLGSYSIARQGESLAIKIDAESHDARLAADIANTVAETYIAESDRDRQAGITRSIDFLRTRVTQLNEELSADEIALAAFVRENSLDDETMPDRQRADIERLQAIYDVVSGDDPTSPEAEELKVELDLARSDLLIRSRAELRLIGMERSLELLRSRYQSSIERLNELETQLQFVSEGARQVTIARIPSRPFWPNPVVILGGGIFAGAFLSILLVALLEALNTRIWSDGQISASVGAVNYGFLPKIKRRKLWDKKQDLIPFFIENPRSPYAEALRNFLTLWFNREGLGRVVLVTSGLPSEGKSTVAVSIALAAAREGLKVLVLDLDSYRLGASRTLDAVHSINSLEDAASGKARPKALKIEGLPEGSISLLNVAVRSDASVKDENALLSELKSRIDPSYDLVLVDTPPILVVNDACRVGSLIDGTLFVVRWGRTRLEELQDAFEKLDMHGIEATATLINDVDLDKQRQYGYGTYSYYSDYSKAGYS